jgi:hypothetical protein
VQRDSADVLHLCKKYYGGIVAGKKQTKIIHIVEMINNAVQIGETPSVPIVRHNIIAIKINKSALTRFLRFYLHLNLIECCLKVKLLLLKQSQKFSRFKIGVIFNFEPFLCNSGF